MQTLVILVTQMRRRPSAVLNSLLFHMLAAACVIGVIGTKAQDKSPIAMAPFSVAVSADLTRISMAQKDPDKFYVVLTNISERTQAVWRSGNSWAYKNISFELRISDGRSFVISQAPQAFTRNFPSTSLVEPGEHQVYTIRLDKWWETHPPLPKSDEMPITLKAIYEVHPTPESAKFKVWTGRVESKTYSFVLRQCKSTEDRLCLRRVSVQSAAAYCLRRDFGSSGCAAGASARGKRKRRILS